jgi:pre-mRNA-processing factor 19
LKPQAGITSNVAGNQAVTTPSVVGAQTVESGMTQEILDQLQNKAKVLTGERRKKSKMVPEDLISADDIKSFRTTASHPGKKNILF